ncbi:MULTISPECIES: rRNA maturation RNase YbeY [unclassified Spirosoma]|uniref:rRNA maturation RNase YbeY n=1 Tax=unclassified Spirosoma TaxID=2621999 RepID=UPI0009625217|nr:MULTISPECIES: rRNA maturation RNase YbeY [unclassified Spirosoma]MBN8825049.1 rRNA maturation RNase YbeY [Spirosoma sp.]OJW73341.1 MAG: rRNA maturation RNase YbeY [Spirosoma sp. 48-14]
MIRFFNEDVPYKLPHKQAVRQWLKQQTEREGYTVGELNYIFCSDEYVLQVNRDYLQHDYYTDIITFDQSEEEGKLAGDIYISVERVVDNAAQLDVPADQEMLRVLAHGLLHLCGYLDKGEEEEAQMRQKEEEWLHQYNNA